MKCPKCHREIISASIDCSCGFTFKGNPLWAVSPVSEPILSEITSLLQSYTIKKLPGWGPARPTYTNQNPAHHAVFNSITDNAAVGDERDFVRIAEKNSGNTYSSDIVIEAGRQYEVYIYYHNNASSTYNDKAHHYVGVARGTRLATSFPVNLEEGEKGAVVGILKSDTTDPPEVWDAAYVTAKEDMTLHFVEGSAQIYNAWNKSGTMLSTRIFSPKGTYIGLSELNGVIPGCDQYSGSIVYTIQTKAAQIEQNKEITYPNGDKYIGDVKLGKRHGIGTLYHSSGEVCEGVWVKDVFSSKLSSIRQANNLVVDDGFLELLKECGITLQSIKKKEEVVENIAERQDDMFGREVISSLSDAQLIELEKMLDNSVDDDELENWFEKNVRNISEIALVVSKKFLDEVLRDFLDGGHKYIPDGYLNVEN